MMTSLGEPVQFTVKSLDNKVLPAADPAEAVAFKRKSEDLDRKVQSAGSALRSAINELNHIRKAITQMEQPEDIWLKDVINIEKKIKSIQWKLQGDPLKSRLDQDPTPSIADRIGRVNYESRYSSAKPTQTHQHSLAIAEEELTAIIPQVRQVLEQDMAALRTRLQNAGAPYTPNVIPVFGGQ